jgi:eukaryotic-like serine/threonine-protein kinase
LSLGNGSVTSRPFLETPFTEQWAEFSPDGRWLAYGSDESGRPEVYVRPYPGPGRRETVSTNGGTRPAWARGGRELFYTEPHSDGTIAMMAVDVTPGPTFGAGRPRKLFAGRYSQTVSVRSYDVTGDGNRFLMVQTDHASTDPPITQIVLVFNWFQELKARAEEMKGP